MTLSRSSSLPLTACSRRCQQHSTQDRGSVKTVTVRLLLSSTRARCTSNILFLMARTCWKSSTLLVDLPCGPPNDATSLGVSTFAIAVLLPIRYRLIVRHSRIDTGIPGYNGVKHMGCYPYWNGQDLWGLRNNAPVNLLYFTGS